MNTNIERVQAQRLWDSRGRPTIEVEITLQDGSKGRGIAPAGASRGRFEAVDLRDGGDILGGQNVSCALRNVETEIADRLTHQDASDQRAIDQALIDLDGTSQKARLGGNALIATSMAVLNAAAASQHVPLWRHISNGGPVSIPLPEVQIFGGGVHAGRRTDIQDFLVMPVGARSFDEAMTMTADVYHAAGRLMQSKGVAAGVADEGGWWPNFASNEEALDTLACAIRVAGYDDGQMLISLDIAASEFSNDGRYTLALDQRSLDREEWLAVLLRWLKMYPIASIEDPMAQEDAAGMAAFTHAAGAHVQVVGDDFLVTDVHRVRAAEAQQACNAILIKPNQVGTITEAKMALDAAREAKWGTIVSARSGETEDVVIAHLAIGWNAGQIKVGSFARSERMAKWNEILRIEKVLGDAAQYVGRTVLPGHLA